MTESGLKNFLSFLFAGGIAAAANFLFRFVFSLFLDFGLAVGLAYLAGMVVAFLLFKKRVFTDSQISSRTSMFRFTLVNIFGLMQTVLVSLLAIQVLNFGPLEMREALAHFFGMSLSVITSYLGHRFYTFRN